MIDLTALNLPESVTSRVKFGPMEDVLLAVLREDFDGVPIYSLIPEDIQNILLDSGDLLPAPGYFASIRRLPGFGSWGGDERWVDSARVGIQVFTQDPDGDEKGALISEAIRASLSDAWRNNRQTPYGYIARVVLENEPSRKTDWATSSGPVQYADLPAGVWRYEAIYQIKVRSQA